MDTNSPPEKAVELLQDLGLKEYEAKAFIALTQIPNGTAREVSEISDVPRTRVYDAVESLQAKGLVEIQHANPKQFRAVPIDEAVSTLRDQYESRTASLRETLNQIQPINTDTEEDLPQKVWSLAGRSAITSRVTELIDGAGSEVVMFIGDENGFADPIGEAIAAACSRGVPAYVGATSEEITIGVEQSVPDATVVRSNQAWMKPPQDAEAGPVINRLLLVDERNILVSTLNEHRQAEPEYETAICGQGFDNGFVAVVRRLIATEGVSVPEEAR
jgi:sugar-specific transcriptional regulator TrmB